MNVCLVDQIVKMTVVDQELQDQVMIDTIRHRRRLEQEANMPGDDYEGD